MTEHPTPDPATIDAVGEIIWRVYDFWWHAGRLDHQPLGPQIARALAEAGRLKDPADEILTPEARAVLTAVDEWRAALVGRVLSQVEWEAAHDTLHRRLANAVARRVAVGGTEEQP